MQHSSLGEKSQRLSSDSSMSGKTVESKETTRGKEIVSIPTIHNNYNKLYMKSTTQL